MAGRRPQTWRGLLAGVVAGTLAWEAQVVLFAGDVAASALGFSPGLKEAWP